MFDNGNSLQDYPRMSDSVGELIKARRLLKIVVKRRFQLLRDGLLAPVIRQEVENIFDRLSINGQLHPHGFEQLVFNEDDMYSEQVTESVYEQYDTEHRGYLDKEQFCRYFESVAQTSPASALTKLILMGVDPAVLSRTDSV